MGNKSKEIRDVFMEGRVMWAKVQEPHASEKFVKATRNYSLDLEVTNEQVDALKEAGVNIGEGQFDKKLVEVDGVTYLKGIKRPEHKADGTLADALEVVGPDLAPFTDLVGNGSVCRIKVALIPTEGQTIMYLKAVQVLEHVEFSGQGGNLSGFTAVGSAMGDATKDSAEFI